MVPGVVGFVLALLEQEKFATAKAKSGKRMSFFIKSNTCFLYRIGVIFTTIPLILNGAIFY